MFTAVEGVTSGAGNQLPDSATIWASLWFRTGDPTQTSTILEKTGAYTLRLVAGAPEFTVTTSGGPCTVVYAGAVSANAWLLVAGWYDGLSVTVSINGSVKSSSCSTGRIVPAPGSVLTLGGKLRAGTWSEALIGNVDEVRIRATAPFKASAAGTTSSLPVWRWTTFHTYDQNRGWWWDNSPGMFSLGVEPSNWTDGNATVDMISSNKEWLRSVLTKRGTGGANASIIQDNFLYYSSTDGPVTIAMFRIRNDTAQPITWNVQFAATYYQGWGERASIALNGANQWTSSGDCNQWACQDSVSMSIPPNRTSSVLFASLGGVPAGNRSNVLVINNDSAILPSGLSYVDDFDTMTGDWSQ